MMKPHWTEGVPARPSLCFDRLAISVERPDAPASCPLSPALTPLTPTSTDTRVAPTFASNGSFYDQVGRVKSHNRTTQSIVFEGRCGRGPFRKAGSHETLSRLRCHCGTHGGRGFARRNCSRGGTGSMRRGVMIWGMWASEWSVVRSGGCGGR